MVFISLAANVKVVGRIFFLPGSFARTVLVREKKAIWRR
jgi:hypothetical protein